MQLCGYEGLASNGLAPTPGWFAQCVGERLDYQVTWDLPTGDTIVESVWSTDTGLTLSDASFDAGSTTVWVSGGDTDYIYRIYNTITTAGGRVQTVRLLVRITATAPCEGWAPGCRTMAA